MPPLTPQQAFDLAMEHHRAGRFAVAEELYRQIHALHPESVDVIHLLGVVARDSGRLPEALEWINQSIALQPQVARYYSNLGLVLADCHRLEESAAALEKAQSLDPGSAEIAYNLGITRARQGHWEEAITAYRSAIRLNPSHIQAWLNLGLCFSTTERREEAIAVYREAQSRFPNDHTVALNLGNVLQDQGRLDEALIVFQTAVALAPKSHIVLNNLAILYKNRGEIADSIRCLRQCLALQPDATVHSNLIFTLQFDPEAAPEIIREEERLWNSHFAIPLRPERHPHCNERSPDRRLRLGYLSADLRNHVVGRTLLPVFEAHDRNQFECICYGPRPTDFVAKRFQAGASLWRNIEDSKDSELAAQIREDQVDILIDLGLHTAFNRLPVFARQPAPVQISWLGYPGATGVEAIDYWISDRFLSPEDTPDPRALRLPDAWCCYLQPEDSPPVTYLPSQSTGHITFASFNNFSKINARVLRLWAGILAAVPHSRLLLLAKGGGHQQKAVEFLTAHGIDPQRVQFLTYEPAAQNFSAGAFLQRYAQVDIALDPFPYNGMTTTCDALWMGVPVITLRGRSSIGRASFSLLSNLGLAELAAGTEDEYLALAISLAANPARLLGLRSTLRDRMLHSPLLDASRFARHLESAFRGAWRQWCLRPE